MPLQEERAELTDFTPNRVHLLLKGFYVDYPHHKNGIHLEGGVLDDAVWQCCWHQLDAQLARWYATSSELIGCGFTEILATEWKGVLDRSWNSEILLDFAHIIFTKTFGVLRVQEI